MTSPTEAKDKTTLNLHGQSAIRRLDTPQPAVLKSFATGRTTYQQLPQVNAVHDQAKKILHKGGYDVLGRIRHS